MVFLAFDVFFIIFCIGIACVIFFALFCIIPVIAVAYALKIREGASEEDIMSLPKYRFSQSNALVLVDDNMKQLVKAKIDSYSESHASELSVHPDDSVSTNSVFSYLSFHNYTILYFYYHGGNL